MPITNAGLNYALNTALNDGTKVTTWYVGLIHDTNFSALSGSDTMSSHSGWEESTAYAESARPEWTEGAASSQQTTNATQVDFTMTAATTVKGIFLTSVSTKGGATGTLFAAALFDDGDRDLTAGQQLRVTLTINGSDVTVS